MRQVCIAIIFGLVFFSCGQSSDFAGSAEAKPKLPPQNLTIDWLWNCNDVSDEGHNEIAVQDSQTLEIHGNGEFNLPLTPESKLNMNISGGFCPASEIPRDIVFIIDVSGSMEKNDPRIDDSCGRLDAIEMAISDLSSDLVGEDESGDASGAQFAVVTFSKTVSNASTKFFRNQKSLYTDLTSGSKVEDVLCAFKDSTNYDEALQRAEILLLSGRVGATKEIYFISDGEPDPNKDGIVLANKMKKKGLSIGNVTRPVTIATIMLKGNDLVMEQYIASRDPDNNPMHARVETVEELSEVLAHLAVNELKTVTLKYKLLVNSEWTFFDLPDPKDSTTFEIPSFDILFMQDLKGIEINYRYETSRGSIKDYTGTLLTPIIDHL